MRAKEPRERLALCIRALDVVRPAYTGYSPVQPGTNGLAVASMVLGILWLWWVGSVWPSIFGHVSLSQIKRTDEDGRPMAIAGLIVGYICLACPGPRCIIVATPPTPRRVRARST